MSAGAYRLEKFPLLFEYKGIYSENLLILNQNTFLVCALFTPNQGKYDKQAQRLTESCEEFGLPYIIYEVPSIHTSINLKGTHNLALTKANFIAYNMERFPTKKHSLCRCRCFIC